MMTCEKCISYRPYKEDKQAVLDGVGFCKKDEANPEFKDDKYIHPFKVRAKSLVFCSCYTEKEKQ